MTPETIDAMTDEGTTPADRSAGAVGDVRPVARRVEVLGPSGLHARPAHMIATCVRRFEASVTLVLVEAPSAIGAEPGARVDASSVMEVLFLAAPQGTVLDVEAVGPDAEAAVVAVEALFTSSFQMP